MWVLEVGMVQVRCDKCDRTIEVESAVVGQKVTCPHCGDVNVIRAAGGEARPARDAAAAAGYPSASGPEQDVRRVRPAMFRARPFLFVGMVAVFVAGLVGAVVFAPAWFVGAGVSVAALVVLVVWKLRTMGEGLVVTNKRIIDREGFFRKDTSEIRFADIKNVQVRQGFTDRLLGVGTIVISTAGEHEDTVAMSDVPRPDELVKLIDLYRNL